MQKNKLIKMGITLVMIPLALMSLKIKKSYAASNCEEVQNTNVKYVNATFIDINPEQYNKMIRNITPEEYYVKNDEEKSKYDEKALLFGSTEGMNRGGIQNGYISPGRYRDIQGVTQGLVQSKLQNGNLAVSNQFTNGTTLFPNTNSQTGYQTPYNEILNNWKFPFLKEENGYYSFNSDQYHVSKDYSNKKFILHKGNKYGFYPFNNCSDDTSNQRNRNLYFTAKFEIPFIMTSDGKVKNTSTGNLEDMVFNFFGDDDVWIFVDDTLVVDLGGTHIKQTGNINFAKNQVYYSSIYNKQTDTDEYNIYKTGFSNGKLSPGKHTLKVFYMERAGGVSNLLVSFNLQSAGVKVNHVDKYTNETLKSEVISGPVGEKIKTTEEIFESYRLVEKPEIEEIELSEEMKNINYYYERPHNVIINYIDEITNEKISESEIKNLYKGEEYSSKEKEIENYILTKKPEITSGVMDYSDITINYYYKHEGKLIANYIDKSTNEKLESKEFNGGEGDKIFTEDKNFDNYLLYEKPNTNEYVLTKELQEVNYYYIKQSKIIVNYIDKETNEKLENTEDIVNEGTIYETEERNFKNYILIEKPEINTYLIGRKDITVNYYYRKLRLNLKIDMNLQKATVNSHIYDLKGKVGKVEAELKEANSLSKVKIYYKVKVMNTEEVEGSGIINIELPEGYIALPEENSNWQINGNEVKKEISNLKPGESVELDLVLNKTSNDDICKKVVNKVKVTSTTKEFNETSLEDNEDINELIIMPRTGIKKISILGIIIMLGCSTLVIIKLKKKRRNKVIV